MDSFGLLTHTRTHTHSHTHQLCSLFIILTGSVTASFSLLLGIRLCLYTWLQGFIHRCLHTSISNLVDQRLSQSQCEFHSFSNLPPTTSHHLPIFPLKPSLPQARLLSLYSPLSDAG